MNEERQGLIVWLSNIDYLTETIIFFSIKKIYIINNIRRLFCFGKMVYLVAFYLQTNVFIYLFIYLLFLFRKKSGMT